MVEPRLVHPVMVTIQPVDPATTVYDRGTRDPVRTVARKADVKMLAQPHFVSLSEPELIAVGFTEDIRGWLTVRDVDLTAKSYTPHHGDCIVKIGKRTWEMYITLMQDRGHYTDQQGSTLRRLYFTDRRPSAATPAM